MAKYLDEAGLATLWGKVKAGDSAVQATCSKIAYGSYVGTGTYGAGAPNIITMPFAADVLIMLTAGGVRTGKGNAKTITPLWSADMNCVLPMSLLTTSYCTDGTSMYKTSLFGTYDPVHYISTAKKSSDGKTVYWYFENDAAGQFNSEGSNYYWMAIKFAY